LKLKCAPLTVTRALERMGLEPNRAEKNELFADSAPSVPPDVVEQSIPPVSTPEDATQPPPVEETGETASSQEPATEEIVEESKDIDPQDRSLDRFLASQGAIKDAAPLFAPGENLPWVGILLAIPALVRSGLLIEAQRLYGDIGPAFYGLRTTLLLIVMLSLLRIKRLENLKEYSPTALGRVFGLDRVPEVKTMRQKLHRLTNGPSEELMLAVAQRRTQTDQEALAWLYVDGHVRVYSGKERISQTHVTRMRTSLPATQDMWVNDGDGRPLLFVTQESHPSLATALLPLLDSAREVIGKRPATVVFDRGGWSPKLFEELVDLGYDVLTYRKGKIEPIPTDWFVPHPGGPGQPIWHLHDASVLIRGNLWMRQITCLVGEHQTTIVTTRHDLPARTLAERMFNRWKQENFFKYMRQEFDIDGLCEYGAEEDDLLREVPNPDWNDLNNAVRKARLDHQALLASTLDRKHPDVVAAATRMSELRQQRKVIPKRIRVADLKRRTVRLPARAKNLYDGLKTVAWHIETELVRAISPFYHRTPDEGRTLITAALRSAGSLQVCDGQLVVTLAPQSSPHRTRAIALLCQILDQTRTRFPGSSLRIRYRVEDMEPAANGVPTTISAGG
jgi:hypothetical protein